MWWYLVRVWLHNAPYSPMNEYLLWANILHKHVQTSPGIISKRLTLHLLPECQYRLFKIRVHITAYFPIHRLINTSDSFCYMMKCASTVHQNASASSDISNTENKYIEHYKYFHLLACFSQMTQLCLPMQIRYRKCDWSLKCTL